MLLKWSINHGKPQVQFLILLKNPKLEVKKIYLFRTEKVWAIAQTLISQDLPQMEVQILKCINYHYLSAIKYKKKIILIAIT